MLVCNERISIRDSRTFMLKASLSCSEMHVMSTWMKGFRVNNTVGSSLSRSWNSCPSLDTSWEYFSVPLPKAPDAGAWSFSADCTEGKVQEFLAFPTRRQNCSSWLWRHSQHWQFQRHSWLCFVVHSSKRVSFWCLLERKGPAATQCLATK